VLTVDRLDDGEVSPYLTAVLEAGDKLELRGPVGGWFVWEAKDGGPLLLVGGGSGVVPLMAMIRHRAAVGSEVPARLVYSSRSYEEVIYREELEKLAAGDDGLEVIHTLTRSRPEGWEGYGRRIDARMLSRKWPGPRRRIPYPSCAARRRWWRRRRPRWWAWATTRRGSRPNASGRREDRDG
jgi:ferredoxin-NADP reductase